VTDTPTPDGQSWPPAPGSAGGAGNGNPPSYGTQPPAQGQPPAGGYGTGPAPNPYGQPAPAPASDPTPPAYGAPAPQQPAYGAPPPAYSAPAYGAPAGGAYGQPGYGFPAAAPSKPNDGMAVASMVVGIAGLVFSLFCFWFFGITIIPCAVAVVLGILARKRITESNGALGGEGMALAGLITGGLGTVWSALWVVLYIIGALT
jgi:hypothetical protein